MNNKLIENSLENLLERNSIVTDIVNEAVNHILRNSILCVEDFSYNSPTLIGMLISKIREGYKIKTDTDLTLVVITANDNHYLVLNKFDNQWLNSFPNNLEYGKKINTILANDTNVKAYNASSLWNNEDMREIVEKAIADFLPKPILCVEDFIKKNLTIISKALLAEIQKSYCIKFEKNLTMKQVPEKGNHYLHSDSVEIEEVESITKFLRTMNKNKQVAAIKKAFDERKPSTKMNKNFTLDTTSAEFEYKMTSLSNNFFYRGQANSNFELLPSLYRSTIWEEKEDELYHDLIVKCPNNFQNKKRHIDILKEMQHYSLPTRLLDITQNPLVALYFAVSEHEGQDGELVMFYHSNKIKNASSDTIEILCALASLPFRTKQNLYKVAQKANNIKDFNKSEFTKKLLHEIKLAIGSFENIIKHDDLLGIQFVKPLQDNPRIVRQNGYFIVNGLVGTDKGALISKYDEQRYKVGSVTKRFIIPHDKKMDILRELSLLGINKSTIYPEIDKVSEYLKSYVTINY